MASSGDTATYRIIQVPKDSPRLAELIIKSRAERLHVLETDPTSFLSKHATEFALPMHVWEKRFRNPTTTVFACVATHPSNSQSSSATNGFNTTSIDDDETALLTCEWVGLATVRGPMLYKDYYVTPDMGLPIPEKPEEEARWHVFDLYTLPSHRGRGLAKRLVNHCIDLAAEQSRALTLSSSQLDPGEAESCDITKARIRLFMNPKNAWLIEVYERLGFRAAGKVTLEEGFRANAADDSIPLNTRENEEVEKLWHTRFGLAMEQVVSVERSKV